MEPGHWILVAAVSGMAVAIYSTMQSIRTEVQQIRVLIENDLRRKYGEDDF